MPEDLLLELETAPPMGARLDSIEELVREAMSHAPQVALAIKGMKGLAATFEKTWQRIVANVAKGHTVTMHAVRPPLASSLQKRLGSLKDRIPIPWPNGFVNGAGRTSRTQMYSCRKSPAWRG